jgi:lipoprotein-anchoring transpeptidase ErfK/SrfK
MPLLPILLLSACTPVLGAGAGQARPKPSPTPLPQSVAGSIAFSPPADATGVALDQPVEIRPAVKGAVLSSVTVAQDGGPSLTGALGGGVYTVKAGQLQPDAHYTVTAIAMVSQAGGAAPAEDDETAHFATVTTPRVTGLTPSTIGEGGSVVLTLSQAAASIDVSGPVKASLGPDGKTVTVVPDQYQQGQTYSFTLTAKSQDGVVGAAQSESFGTLGAATASAYPSGSNLGVGVPLILVLSDPPADRSDFASHLSVTVDATAPPASPAAATPPASPSPGASGGNVCGQYAEPAGASLNVTPVWTSATRVRLMPQTPDGYWPADSTLTLHAAINNLRSSSGNWWASDVGETFKTADKRVIDVDLTSQTLTACDNGTQVNQFLISSGTTKHFTYTGKFAIYRRVQDEEMKSPEGQFAPDYYDIKHVPWTQYFDGGAALHGAWWHNNFGHPMSHGCVNVQTPTDNVSWPHALPQAEWLWNFDYIGDPVIVHGVTPGLTPAQQLSD